MEWKVQIWLSSTFSDGEVNGKLYFLNKLITDRKYNVIEWNGVKDGMESRNF